MLRADTRSKSYAGRPSGNDPSSSYESTLTDIRRLRSTRMDKHLSNAGTKRGRESKVIDSLSGPRPGSAGADGNDSQRFHVVRDQDASGQEASRMTFGHQDSMRLDDIPRLIAAEQAKEQRPNASRYARGGLGVQEPKPKLMSSHRRDTSGGQELEKLGPEGHRPKRYFSELTALEYFIVRHVACLAIAPLLPEGCFNQEELLALIEEGGKTSFWHKMGIKRNNNQNKNIRKKGIFEIPLDVLVERDGEECSDGVGPNPLKIPAIIEDTIVAMKSKDMSVEGVFRKNGNIRNLRLMEEKMNAEGTSDAVSLENESPVQVAALLKRFLRSLPDPVMTFKLHKLWVTSASKFSPPLLM